MNRYCRHRCAVHEVPGRLARAADAAAVAAGGVPAVISGVVLVFVVDALNDHAVVAAAWPAPATARAATVRAATARAATARVAAAGVGARATGATTTALSTAGSAPRCSGGSGVREGVRRRSVVAFCGPAVCTGQRHGGLLGGRFADIYETVFVDEKAVLPEIRITVLAV
jgi:hypothetical protein